jgi:predicted dehydrogenase
MANRQITRRDFMKSTAGATGVALAGNAVMLEASPASASPRPVPPSDRVRFGIIGVGMQGSGLLRTSIKLPGVECAAACDLYDGRVELAKEIVDKPDLKTSKRYKELLDNKDIDCIIAAVPDHWHKQIVVDACDAGKDIYCEKPMTHMVAQGLEMIAAEKRNNRIVQIGSQRASSIVYDKAKELFEKDVLGDVCLIEAGMGRNDPCGAWEYTVPPDLSPQTLDWETWLGSAPRHGFDKLRWTRWRCYQDYGEGIPGDLFVHLLTGIHHIMGVTTPPDRALSAGGLFRWKDGRDVPDVMTTLYEYPNFRTTLRVTLNTDYDEYTRLMGTKGLLEIHGNWLSYTPQDGEDHGPCTPGWPKKMRSEYGEKWHDEHDPKPGTQSMLEGTTFFTPPGYDEDREHLWNYFQSVRTRKPSVEDATFGNNTAIGCHMANYSYFNRAVAIWSDSEKQIIS